MTDIQKKAIWAGSIAVIIILLVIGITIFLKGMKGEFRKDSMADDYFEVDRALDLKNKCDRNRDGEACLETARYYLEGKHVDENRKKAAHYLAKSCSYDNGDGCYHLGTFWHDVKAGNRSANNRKASKYFKKACDLGNDQGCIMADKMGGK